MVIDLHFPCFLIIFFLATTLTYALPASGTGTKSEGHNTSFRGCEVGSRVHLPGSRFKVDQCTNCWCPWQGGGASCVTQDCSNNQHCLLYSGEKDQCCQKCLEMGCRHTDGKVYEQGEVIRNEPCVRCYCPLGGGAPVCDVTSCPMSQCVDPVQVPGICCPTCPNGPNCQIGLLTLPVGQSVTVEGANCTCKSFTDQEGVDRTLARCNKGI